MRDAVDAAGHAADDGDAVGGELRHQRGARVAAVRRARRVPTTATARRSSGRKSPRVEEHGRRVCDGLEQVGVVGVDHGSAPIPWRHSVAISSSGSMRGGASAPGRRRGGQAGSAQVVDSGVPGGLHGAEGGLQRARACGADGGMRVKATQYLVSACAVLRALSACIGSLGRDGGPVGGAGGGEGGIRTLEGLASPTRSPARLIDHSAPLRRMLRARGVGAAVPSMVGVGWCAVKRGGLGQLGGATPAPRVRFLRPWVGPPARPGFSSGPAAPVPAGAPRPRHPGPAIAGGQPRGCPYGARGPGGAVREPPLRARGGGARCAVRG